MSGCRGRARASVFLARMVATGGVDGERLARRAEMAVAGRVVDVLCCLSAELGNGEGRLWREWSSGGAGVRSFAGRSSSCSQPTKRRKRGRGAMTRCEPAREADARCRTATRTRLSHSRAPPAWRAQAVLERDLRRSTRGLVAWTHPSSARTGREGPSAAYAIVFCSVAARVRPGRPAKRPNRLAESLGRAARLAASLLATLLRRPQPPLRVDPPVSNPLAMAYYDVDAILTDAQVTNRVQRICILRAYHRGRKCPAPSSLPCPAWAF